MSFVSRRALKFHKFQLYMRTYWMGIVGIDTNKIRYFKDWEVGGSVDIFGGVELRLHGSNHLSDGLTRSERLV